MYELHENITDLLARKIMKWKPCPSGCGWNTEDEFYRDSETFYPIFDIGDAWSLMEKFEESLLIRKSNGESYEARVIDKGVEFVGEATIAPKAIVNAILNYLGEDFRFE